MKIKLLEWVGHLKILDNDGSISETKRLKTFGQTSNAMGDYAKRDVTDFYSDKDWNILSQNQYGQYRDNNNVCLRAVYIYIYNIKVFMI